MNCRCGAPFWTPGVLALSPTLRRQNPYTRVWLQTKENLVDTTMTTLSKCRGVGLKATVHQNTQVEPDVSFKLHPTEANILGIRTSGEDTGASGAWASAQGLRNLPWGPV